MKINWNPAFLSFVKVVRELLKKLAVLVVIVSATVLSLITVLDERLTKIENAQSEVIVVEITATPTSSPSATLAPVRRVSTPTPTN
jgi:hypothetical protein